jgi:hypothetical protein
LAVVDADADAAPLVDVAIAATADIDVELCDADAEVDDVGGGRDGSTGLARCTMTSAFVLVSAATHDKCRQLALRVAKAVEDAHERPHPARQLLARLRGVERQRPTTRRPARRTTCADAKRSSASKIAPQSLRWRMTRPIAWLTARSACCLYHALPSSALSDVVE